MATTIQQELSRKMAAQLSRFGVTARYESVNGGPAVDVTVIFAEPDNQQDAPRGALKFAFGSVTRSGLTAAPAEGDVLWQESQPYRVCDVSVDSGGMFRLALRAVIRENGADD